MLSRVSSVCRLRLLRRDTCSTNSSRLSLSRSFSSLPPQLLGHPFGLRDVDSSLRHYRASILSNIHDYTAPAVITHLIERCKTEQYALAWEQHVRTKVSKGEDELSDEAIVRDMHYCRLWAGLLFEVADISMHSMETIVTERIHKRFVIMNDDQTQGVRCEVTWTLEKNKLPHSNLNSYKATCEIQELGKEGEPVTGPDQPSPAYPLFTITDYASPQFHIDTWNRLVSCLNMTPLNNRDRIWFWSSLASHPTDYAFDVISGVMEEALPHEENNSSSNNNNNKNNNNNSNNNNNNKR